MTIKFPIEKYRTLQVLSHVTTYVLLATYISLVNETLLHKVRLQCHTNYVQTPPLVGRKSLVGFSSIILIIAFPLICKNKVFL